MRIIAGIARGLPLAAPHGGQVRPTADRIREAIFSSLADRVIGADVLDLFAGTGALGLEAASRGARAVTFVESAAGAIEVLRRNIEAFRRQPGAACELTVIRAEVAGHCRKLAAAQRAFQLIFADPPYGPLAQALASDVELPRLLAPGGLLVLESGKRNPLVPPPHWVPVRESLYGDTRVTFLKAA